MAWLPFDGKQLSAETPREFDVFDMNRGHQSGLNSWPGLRRVAEQYLPDFWTKSPWLYHA